MAFGTKTNERPGTRAQVKHVRSSAYKAREILNLIRGESYARASEILEFSDRIISEPVAKVLDSAVANAENNDSLLAEELYISACYADEGPTLKRWRPRARGRATPIRKRTCHITVIVSRYSPEELEEIRGNEAARGSSSRATAAESRRDRVQKSKEAAAAKADEHDHDHGDEAGNDEVVDSTSEESQATQDTVETTDDAEGTGNTETMLAGDAAADTADDDSSGDGGDAPHGEGSHAPIEGDAMPEGFPIKGNADSMKYHVPDSRYYDATIAEVWFATTEAAEAAGYVAPGGATASTEESTEESMDD